MHNLIPKETTVSIHPSLHHISTLVIKDDSAINPSQKLHEGDRENNWQEIQKTLENPLSNEIFCTDKPSSSNQLKAHVLNLAPRIIQILFKSLKIISKKLKL